MCRRGASLALLTALSAAACYEAAGPNLSPNRIIVRTENAAGVVVDGAALAGAQAEYPVRRPITPPELLFGGPGGAVLRLRFADLARRGTVETDGITVIFEWTAPDGRVFRPRSVCAMTLTDPLDPETPPWIEGQAICETAAPDGAAASVLVHFFVDEP